MRNIPQEEIDAEKNRIKNQKIRNEPPGSESPEIREIPESEDRDILERIYRGMTGRTQVESIKDAWPDIERVLRLGDLVGGTGISMHSPNLQIAEAAIDKARGGSGRTWIPSITKAPDAFSAFVDQARQGDVDAAIKAYEDEMGAGKGYWPIAGGIGSAFISPGLSTIGKGLPKLAQTVGRVLPIARGRGVQQGAELLSKGLDIPWKVEQAAGEVIAAPFRAIPKVWRWLGGRPATEAVEQVTEGISKPIVRAGDVAAESQILPHRVRNSILKLRNIVTEGIEQYRKGKLPGAKVKKTIVDDKLPSDLATAKPGFNIGRIAYKPKFESPIDMAFFIVSRVAKLSSRDADYMAYLQKLFPNRTTQQIRILGAEVREHIKKTVQGEEAGDIKIYNSGVGPRELNFTKRVMQEQVPKSSDKAVMKDRAAVLNDIMNEMKKRGVKIPRGREAFAKSDVYGEINTILSILEKPGDKRAKALIYDAIARRHGGISIADEFDVLFDVRPREDITGGRLNLKRLATDNVQANKDTMQVMDEAEALMHGPKPPPRQPVTKLDDDAIVANIFEDISGSDIFNNPQLGLWSKSINALTSLSNEVLRAYGIKYQRRERTIGLEGIIETASRLINKVISKGVSDANVIATQLRAGVRKNFKTDDAGNILDEALQNRARVGRFGQTDAILQSPTVADMAARYPIYEPFLTQAQKDFMMTQEQLFETGVREIVDGKTVITPGYNKLLRDSDPAWLEKGERTDIMEGGWYMPRGKVVTKEGTQLFNSLDQRVLAKEISAEKHASMPAMGKIVDPDGVLMPGLNAHTYQPLEKVAENYVADVIQKVTGIKIMGKEGLLTKIAKEFPGTKEIERYPGATKSAVYNKPILEGVDTATDAFAAALKREFLNNPFWGQKHVDNFNNMYRGIRANWDLSAFGIHGSLPMWRSPSQWARAVKLTFKVLYDHRNSTAILDDHRIMFDQKAKANGRLGARSWAILGRLRQGGGAIETKLPGTEWLMRGRTPIKRGVGYSFDLSNRLFGGFSDALRLDWADELLRMEMAKGRTIQQLLVKKANGLTDIEEIGYAANRLTGWSDDQFMGSIGERLMFAPRWFQTRLEQIGQAMVGTSQIRPPTLDALRSMGKTRMHFPFQGKPIIESEVIRSMGRKQTIKSREGLQAISRLIGMGVFMTELANKGDTDRRPIVNGKRNPNFYTIQFGGHKVSLFGGTIGILRAMTILTIEMVREPTKPWLALAAAGRGLTGGWATLIWDNFTGYDYSGRDAPLGVGRWYQEKYDPIPGEEQTGFVADPIDILRYFGAFSLPITIAEVAGEIYGGIKSTAGQDWARVAGAGLGIVGEVGGWRVQKYFRQDEAEELSKERFGVSYETLTYHAQAEIDDLVTEKIGEAKQRGEKGDYYTKKKELDDKLVADSKSIADEHLSGSPASPGYDPALAKNAMNEKKSTHRGQIHGIEWDEEKGRMVGGILEVLYDRDEDKEIPDENTREFRLWQYGQTFIYATDPETGKLDFDKLNKLQDEFWASLGHRTDPTTGKRVNEVDEMLESIRILEEDFDPKIQNLIDAGRYARSFTMTVYEQKIRYFDLDRDPTVKVEIMELSRQDAQSVQRYIDMTHAERKPFRKSPEGDAIGRAFDIITSEAKEKFIDNAPQVWKQAMYEGGYGYPGERGNPPSLEEQNYKSMYRNVLIGQ